MGRLIFVTGGIRSGKSEFAEKFTSQLGSRITYIATARVLDDEMKARVELHRRRRPAQWHTVEEPVDVAGAITEHGAQCDVIMVDCLTGLVTNIMFAGDDAGGQHGSTDFEDLEERVLENVRRMAGAAQETKAHVVVVSNEVGMTLVSDNSLGRRFQDLVGRANQVVAKFADEAYLVTAGYPIALKNGRSEMS